MTEQIVPLTLAEDGKKEYGKGNYKAAAGLFSQAAQAYASTGNVLDAAEMRNNESVALLQAGNAGEALQAVEGTEQVFLQAGDLKRQGIAIGNRAAALEGLKKWKEAQEPNNAAISLVGEPTLYPKLSGLIEEFRSRGFSTFLVTNGQFPEALKKITEPTNIYISLDAPDKSSYRKIDVPSKKDYWERLNKSLELMDSFSCRKVLRLTLVKGWNMRDPEKYAKLIEKANPDFIEAKGYVHVGESQKRLERNTMPVHHEVKAFSEKLSKASGYSFKDEQVESRVVLLSRKA